MKIIKPYGRSHVDAARAKGAPLERRLRLTDNPDPLQDIPTFAREHDWLVLAQWISAIDKIATKPKSGGRPTAEQRALRRKLGDAAWEYIRSHNLLAGLKEPATADILETTWRMKIAPYSRQDLPSNRRAPSAKGRWFARFAGDVEPSIIDAKQVAERIYEHLYIAEYRIHPEDKRKKPRGRIEARAKAIANNTFRPETNKKKKKCPEPTQWTDKDEADYDAAGNVAKRIYEAAEEFIRENGTGGRPVRTGTASRELFCHYGKLFKDSEGRALSICTAKTSRPGVFALHMAVKEFYTRQLKHHRKGNGILNVLPKSNEALFNLVSASRKNRELAALVRLGKVIHYQAFEQGRTEAAYADNWPADVVDSNYWSSDGQAEIKRNEAFVRTWRQVIALMQRTLTVWADPKDEIKGDILLSGPTKKAIEGNFSPDHFDKHARVLFGIRADLFTQAEGKRREILRTALKSAFALRNKSFHFTGRHSFTSAMEDLAKQVSDPDVTHVFTKLWEEDTAGRVDQIRDVLSAAYAEFYFEDADAKHLLGALTSARTGLLPLPRFKRLLTRIHNAWEKEEKAFGLPAPPNRGDLEAPARFCQYTSLKLLYEKPFRTWLEELSGDALGRYFDRAIERTTKEARKMNGGGKSEKERKLIVARASDIPKPHAGDKFQTFFHNLTAKTATEMRVQNAYESDGQNARKQAEFIEEFKCDVLAFAFSDFLRTEQFDFVRELDPARECPPEKACDLPDIDPPAPATRHEHWQTILYLLMHLVPVDDVSRLLHQLRKWQTLESKTDGHSGSPPAPDNPAATPLKVAEVFTLYLDMHDAKFTGGLEMPEPGALENIFDSRESFGRMFHQLESEKQKTLIPRRGLREVMRFGHQKLVTRLAGQKTITGAEIDRWLAESNQQDSGVSPVAAAQERRQDLHEKWAGKRKTFTTKDLREYVNALARVADHRRLAAHVTLTDHVRAHRLLMNVLGRLIDYAGLWERDLYFVSLALCHQLGTEPSTVFGQDNLEILANGQLLEIFQNELSSSEGEKLERELKRLFGDSFYRGKPDRETRNHLMHFNMLRVETFPSGNLNLTSLANDTRQLMVYDRKLKNAVSKSLKDLLAREGIEITWRMTGSATHRLADAKLYTRRAHHLQGKEPSRPVLEDLHGKAYVRMIAAIFGGALKEPAQPKGDKPPPKDVTELDTERLIFKQQQNQNHDRKNNGRNGKRHRQGYKKGGGRTGKRRDRSGT